MAIAVPAFCLGLVIGAIGAFQYAIHVSDKDFESIESGSEEHEDE